MQVGENSLDNDMTFAMQSAHCPQKVDSFVKLMRVAMLVILRLISLLIALNFRIHVLNRLFERRKMHLNRFLRTAAFFHVPVTDYV